MILQLAASLEHCSKHPLSGAILIAAAGFIPPKTGAILQEVIDVLAIALKLVWRNKIGANFSVVKE
jgi:cation transport ATPase